VHIAPGHGADDYELGLANGIEVPETVGPRRRLLRPRAAVRRQARLTQYGKKGDANDAVIAR
jgi:isoleucyl-tRNA synthetase